MLLKNLVSAGLRRATGIAVVAAALVWPAGAQTARPNVIVLVLDQLQADRLHCYGNPRETSRNIDRLAASGVVLSHFYSVAPWTSPSFAALHTSLYPSKNGVTLFWTPVVPLLDKDTPTLAESFQSAGYFTAAYVNNSLAGRALTGSGFDEYTENGAAALDITRRVAGPKDVAAATRDSVLHFLDVHHAGPEPFFLYVHFIEPHSPYDPPPEDDLFHSDAYPNLSNNGYGLAGGELFRKAMVGDDKAIERLYQLYDGKIHSIDRYVGEILDRMHTLGLDGNTYVLLTSDHGELLYSHPDDFLTFDHRSLYDAALHIPLIVAGPGIPAGQKREGLGSNIDTAPTLLALAGLPALPDAEGKSLVPLIKSKTDLLNRYVFAEEDMEIPLRSVRSDRYKLIRNLWTGEDQFFDLQKDPGELHNAMKEDHATAKLLEHELDGWMSANEPSRELQLRRWKIYTQYQKVVTVDEMTTGGAFLLHHRQDWHSDTDGDSGNYLGGSFWTESGDGTRTAIWRGDSPLIGTYRVSVYAGHPNAGTLATNAPFKVVTEEGAKTVEVNLQQSSGTWRPLGTFVNPRYVELSNAADGAVIADAVRFERID
ncbi:MAG: sulfatase-like hydrolase/transferase [Terracidiphilus sp.]|jgi:arylsulfatase A-like enzyme